MNRKKQNIGSPAYQVKTALNRVFKPGRSRHADKAAGIADHYIYGIRTCSATGARPVGGWTSAPNAPSRRRAGGWGSRIAGRMDFAARSPRNAIASTATRA